MYACKYFICCYSSVEGVSLLYRLRKWFGLERDIVVMVFAIVLLTLGEQLLTKYILMHFEYLDASALVIGFYGSMKRSNLILFKIT